MTVRHRRAAGPSAPAETWNRRTAATGPDAGPLDVRGHWLACAACFRGGCRRPPPGRAVIQRLLAFMWAYPFAPLRILADADVTRAHYLDAHEGRRPGGLPRDFRARRDDYVWRRRDLEVCRILGIMPNTEMPAYHAYRWLFERQPTLEGLCRTGAPRSAGWPQCPHARRGYYERIAGQSRVGNLHEQFLLGERLAGRGLWAMVRPRGREAMQRDKDRSARFILAGARRLYIRPGHLLCVLCNVHADPGRGPLAEDNLVELYRRMVREPDIPVTLTEGCDMVCDACNVYHPGEHLCYHAHFKSALRDLVVLEKLGLRPGATLPARRLYRRIYERLGSLAEVCGWRPGNVAPWFAPCNPGKGVLDRARREGRITGRPVRLRRGRALPGC